MNIQKIDIKNFGKLSNLSLDFHDGFNLFLKDNGWGKTTLSVFIKSMFYGLSDTSARIATKNERKKYAPWNGGVFGGSLEFAYDDKQYRIEREFNPEANNTDKFVLYDLKKGIISDDYSEKIGEELLGINAEGFEKSVFFGDKEVSAEFNDSISAKLMSLLESSDDIGSFQKAVENIAEHYKTLDKKTGQIFKLKEELQNLQIKIENAKGASEGKARKIETLKILEERKQEILTKINNVKEEIKKAEEANSIWTHANFIYHLKTEIADKQAEKDNIDKKYFNNVPSIETTKEIKSLYDNYVEKKKQNDKNKAQLESEERNLSYAKGTLEQAIICLPKEEINKFNSATELYQKIIKQQKEADDLEPKLHQPPKQKRPITTYIGIVLTIILFAVGGGIFTTTMVGGIILLCLGGIMLGLSLLLILRSNKTTKDTSNILHNRYSELQKSIEEDTKQLLFYYQVDSFQQVADKQTETQSLLDIKQQTIKDKEAKLEIANNVLVNTKSEYDKSIIALTEAETVLKTKLISINVYSIADSFSAISEAQTLAEKYIVLTSDIRDIQNKLTAYLAENNIPIDIESNIKPKIDTMHLSDDVNRLQRELDVIKEDISRTKFEIERLSSTADEVDQLEDEKENLTEKIDTITYNANIYQKANKYLEQARESLSEKYLSDMKNGFIHYANIITDNKISSFMLDQKMNLKLNELGSYRDINLFSKGYRELTNIALRLALATTLFKNEKPFLIFDDPFTNLDNDKLKHAKNILYEFSKDYQIIYFTCHPSRE